MDATVDHREGGYRHPVDELRRVNPALADRFQETSHQLETLATLADAPSKTNDTTQNSHVSAAASDARWTRQRQLSARTSRVGIGDNSGNSTSSSLGVSVRLK